MKPEYIIVHHTATRQAPWNEAIDSINYSHKGRGFPRAESGYYIGYHRLIDLDGAQAIIRHDKEIGAHCRAKGMNAKSIGVCLIGNFDKVEPTPKQLEKLERELKKICSKHLIPTHKILYHGEVGKTRCCGDHLIKALKKIKKRMDNKEEVSSWQTHAREWALENNVIKDFEGAPFTEEQTYWLCEVLRKLSLL